MGPGYRWKLKNNNNKKESTNNIMQLFIHSHHILIIKILIRQMIQVFTVQNFKTTTVFYFTKWTNEVQYLYV